jgi:uncharacterized membrane protein
MKKLSIGQTTSQVVAWLIVLLSAYIIYLIIRWGQEALGLDFIFRDQLRVGDERRSWVMALVVCPFVIGLALFLFSTAMSRSTKLITLFGTGISYAALAGQIILSMSGSWLLIFPLILPLQPLEKWLGFNRAGYLPIRGEPIQDIIVPALIAFGIGITVVGLVQIVIAAKKKYLTTSGLYASMRHPQHLGIIMWALGFALWGSYYLDFLFWFTLVYVLVLLAWHEEGNLKKCYGNTYHAYQKDTTFMVPFLPKKGALPNVSSGKGIAALAGIYIAGVAVVFCIFYFSAVPR